MYSKLKNLFFFLCFLLLYPEFCLSQDTLKYLVPVNYSVRINPENGREDACNQIIREIASDAVLDLSATGINLSFDVKVKIFPSAEGYSAVTISAGDISVRGNVIIRGFNISKVLIPQLISFSFSNIRKSDSIVLFREKQEEIPFSAGLLNSTVIRQFNPVTDSVAVSVDKMNFNASGLNDFYNHISLINDYYACSAIIDTVNKNCEASGLILFSNLPSDYVLVNELFRAAELIKKKDFHNNLELDSYDPKDMKRSVMEFYRFSKSCAMTFRERLFATQDLQESKIIDPAVLLTDHFERYIRWAMLVNSRNGKIYDDYLNSFFSTSVYDNDRTVLQKMLSLMYPEVSSDKLIDYWSSHLAAIFEKKAEDLMSENRFSEASRLLDTEGDFITYIGIEPAGSRRTMLLNEALNGIYNSYLGIALTSLSYEKQNMAERYFSRAQEFRLLHPEYVSDDSLFSLVSGKLISMSLERCDTLASAGKYDEAINCYKSMGSAFDSLTSIVFKNEIKRKTEICSHYLYRNAGFQYLEKGNMTDAGKFFHLSCETGIKYNLPADTLLDSLCNATFPFYLISILKSHEELIWTNHPDEASRFADSVMIVAGNNNLQGHTQLLSAVSSFRKKLFDKGCYDASDSFSILVLRSQGNYESKNFQRGNSLADSALLIARSHQVCRIDTADLYAAKILYANAALFQKKMKTAVDLISVNRYDTAVDLYVENQKFFRDNNLDKFGISCLDLYDYIYGKNIPSLTLESVNHHLEGSLYNEAYRYLKLLRLEDYPSKETTALQKKIAAALASADFDKDADPLSAAEKYAGKDKWFTAFRSSYVYQWNILKNDLKRESGGWEN